MQPEDNPDLTFLFVLTLFALIFQGGFESGSRRRSGFRDASPTSQSGERPLSDLEA